MTIAVTHPGKHGDALYAIPAIRQLCEKHGAKADFYTSSYCEPLRTLFQAQSCINTFYVSPSYVIERMDMGVQPRVIPLDVSQYEATYQLGFRRVPDCAIPDFIAKEAGFEERTFPICYDTPDPYAYMAIRWLPQDYIVLAPRQSEDYAPLFADIIQKSPYHCVIVGGKGDLGEIKIDKLTLMTGWDYLITAAAISKAKAFIGLMSSPLVLANGFPIPRIAPHDGKSWDMNHVVRSEYNYYPVKPSAEDVLEIIAKATS